MKYLFLCAILLSIITGCRTDDTVIESMDEENIDNSDEQGEDNDNELTGNESIFSSYFDGKLTINEIEIEIGASINISDNEEFVLSSPEGALIGSAVLENNEYVIEITQGFGAFENLSDVSGKIELNNDEFTFTLLGYTITGEPIGYYGDGEWWINFEEYYRSSILTKSKVLFSHTEECRVSVSINGLELGPIWKHYEEDALCSSYYRVNGTSIFNGNFENEESAIRGPSASFVLDSNTDYEYTATWDNGEITTGTFKSRGGGYVRTICLSNPGLDCNYDCNGDVSETVCVDCDFFEDGDFENGPIFQAFVDASIAYDEDDENPLKCENYYNAWLNYQTAAVNCIDNINWQIYFGGDGRFGTREEQLQFITELLERYKVEECGSLGNKK